MSIALHHLYDDNYKLFQPAIRAKSMPKVLSLRQSHLSQLLSRQLALKSLVDSLCQKQLLILIAPLSGQFYDNRL
ncbi:MAG: hypothetical protein GX896_09880 [Clostridiales bacterium]|nr:hypothetical protein [Clostridiales bacterium]